MVDRYFEKTPFFLNISAGCAVEGFGQSFLKSVNGSYTGILGLPLFELRQALKTLGFKF
jgi:predicted house-cleaning NTP pyrophosphatase (Maf/HAM1 superfamily)